MKYRYKYIIFITILLIIFITTYINGRDYNIYRVRKGDTITGISKSFDVNVEELIRINDIKNSDLIKIDEKIKIPLDFKNYIVEKGDYLGKIAGKFKVSPASIITYNNLNEPDKLFSGQRLKIPVTSNREYQLTSRKKNINYIWPVQGKISSNYGWRIHPVRKKRAFHTGIDIAISCGTPVYAAEAGIVSFSGWNNGYGNLVIIKHRDNSHTYYGHNLKLLVEKGETVKQGKVIAISGDSGISTGPHLHFEIRINRRHTNPLNYLNNKYLNNDFRI